MELYLSGSLKNDDYNQMEEQGVLFLLQTFYEMKSWKEEKIKRTLNCCDTFMLDSGASFANNQEQFVSIMGSSFRVVFASMIAYLCSQSWDVFFFHKIRDWYIKKHGTTKGGKWIWNNGSTMTSQIIDTAIFITVAFYGVVPNIVVMIFSQYLIKFIYAALDTPFFYFLTRNSDKQNI